MSAYPPYRSLFSCLPTFPQFLRATCHPSPHALDHIYVEGPPMHCLQVQDHLWPLASTWRCAGGHGVISVKLLEDHVGKRVVVFLYVLHVCRTSLHWKDNLYNLAFSTSLVLQPLECTPSLSALPESLTPSWGRGQLSGHGCDSESQEF